jgi:hypothetical protein
MPFRGRKNKKTGGFLKMKKQIYLWLCLALCVITLAACNGGTSQNEGSPDTSTPAASEKPGTVQNTDNGLGIQARIETRQSGGRDFDTGTEFTQEIEYVVLSGMPDTAIQDKLNEELETFFSWPLFDAENPDKDVSVRADYTIVDYHISVRAFVTEYRDDAAYHSLRANTYDLETGEYCALSEFVNIEPDLINAIKSGAFVQTEPVTPIDGALDILAGQAAEGAGTFWFYLTSNGLGLYITDRTEGDYWQFEAAMSDIESARNNIYDGVSGQGQFHTEVYEDDTAVIEYVFVTGLPDEDVQNKLNGNIKDFYLWQWLYRSPDAEPDNNYCMGTSSYHVIGGRYVSVVRLLGVYDEEHPVNGSAGHAREEISAQTFDLTTGEAAEGLVFGGGAYTMANAVDKFYQVYPDADDAAAKAKFHDSMQASEFIYNYFLTEFALAVYIENDSGDGFYRFDADYDDIPEMLSQELMDRIG